ncbi:DNA cytosine methyltransferase [Rhizobium aethiopicum]|uniref:DNA (cytosine-5-)-methyltransferase n=1 Tax=Rhizobium aethiopicum TaxID=1138170 RepID=A0A7W6MHF8_9HYPH|nr:DNA cytosine methyltransferase [Rhizobium aethiopicum]MBB4192773.1 DNA (cytosine-5)-methyltransferase 1 [Rhizobium aethiopicum]
MKHANDNTPVAGATGIRFLSVCSGIEAASAAWRSLNWQAVAFSEIEKFPSAVLKHHYPDVPNLGDFTKIDPRRLGRVDILCGGTPCQAFSVAGLRQSLADARGNLSLEFVRLAHELADGNRLRNVVWENVVGVLSTKDNAFGCFLAGLVGADAAIEPPARGKWPGAGMVSGPKGRAAWRVLDAQYFGVAQRRRRVIVVADFANGADPAAVLFEQDGLRRHSPPSREAGKDVAPTISARTKGGGGLGTDFDLDGGLVEAAIDGPVASVGNRTSGPLDVSTAVNAHGGPHGRLDFESETFVHHVASTIDASFGRLYGASGQDANHGHSHLVATGTAYSIARDALDRSGEGANGTPGERSGLGILEEVTQTIKAKGPNAVCVTGEVSHALTAEGHDASEEGSGRGAPIIAFDTTQITIPLNRSVPKAGDPCHPLSAGAHPPAITVAIRGREGGATAELGGDVATALRASQGGGDKKPHVLTSAVRRLTPRECERLQGFPDDYTLIPWRGKPADQCPDGPRYKALGNSWAVPKFAWLGERIQRLMPANDNNQEASIAAA